jgi:polyisoprenoid-binding protein YceI
MTLASATETIVPTGSWTIDPAHSTLEFGIKHLGIATVKGRAGGVEGTITGGREPALEGTVRVASLTTFDETRDDHLQSPEFFDVARHPELRFASTAVTQDGVDLVIEGELTIKGVTQPVVLRGGLAGPTTDPWGNERIGVTLHGAVDRRAFGLRWNAPLPGGGLLLGDRVALEASFSATRAT